MVHRKNIGGFMFTGLTLYCRSAFFIGMILLSLSEGVRAQGLPDIPDSAYVRDEIIIWFHEGVLNNLYLGCELFGIAGNDKVTTDLPLSTDFIFSEEIVSALRAIGVASMRKMIPAINPCSDTISIAISGEVMRMPSFWNALVVRFNEEQNIPFIAYGLVTFFNGKILWAQPNFIYDVLGVYNADRGKGKVAYTITPNDSLFSLGRQDRLKHKEIGDAWIDSAWTLSKGDPRIRIGIVDAGFDYRHPDLGGGIGLSYRVRGAWNYDTPKQGTVTWLPWVPQVSHGTSALSVIGAISNNSIGVAGVCGGDDTLTTGTSMYCFSATTSETISDAVWEASANTGNLPGIGGSGNLWKCDILSFSISSSGKYGYDAKGYGLKDEIVRAIIAFRYQNGRSTYAAMGNTIIEHRILNSDWTFTGSPQDVDKEWITTVSATSFDQISNNHGWGMNLDVVAPGSIAACSVDTSQGSQVYSYRTYTNHTCPK